MSETGGNPVLRVNGISIERLEQAMHLATGFPAVGYQIDKARNRLVFFRYPDSNSIPFPAPLEEKQCALMAMEWLKVNSYPSEPDHDGDNMRGWLCFTEDSGHVHPYGWAAFLAIEPEWIEFGK